MIAWARVHGHEVIPPEWDVLCRMDMAYLRSVHTKTTPPPSADPAAPIVSSRPLTPALFDAILK
jgi:hypothetical protein